MTRGQTGEDVLHVRSSWGLYQTYGFLFTLQRAYAHMNAGELAVEKKNDEGALREYGAAEKLVPDNAEMVYWHAVALVNMDRVDESLQLFRRYLKSIESGWS